MRWKILYTILFGLFFSSFAYLRWSSPGSISGAFIAIPQVRIIEQWAGVFFLPLSLLSVWFKPLRNILYVFSFWLFFESLFLFLKLSPINNLVAIFSGALRTVFPVSFLLGKKFRKLFILALAMTFFGHGVEALFGHGQFVDFLLYMAEVANLPLVESSAAKLLILIGSMDVLLAVLVWSRWQKSALIAMMLWGGITSSMRLFYYDSLLVGGIECLWRLPHWIIPLVLLGFSYEKNNSH